MQIGVLVLDATTFHLLTANLVAGSVEPIADGAVAVEIAERTPTEGRLTAKAYKRGMTAIATLLERCETLPVGVATSAFREAANAPVFLDEVNRRFGLHVAPLRDSTVFTSRRSSRARAESRPRTLRPPT